MRVHGLGCLKLCIDQVAWQQLVRHALSCRAASSCKPRLCLLPDVFLDTVPRGAMFLAVHARGRCRVKVRLHWALQAQQLPLGPGPAGSTITICELPAASPRNQASARNVGTGAAAYKHDTQVVSSSARQPNASWRKKRTQWPSHPPARIMRHRRGPPILSHLPVDHPRHVLVRVGRVDMRHPNGRTQQLEVSMHRAESTARKGSRFIETVGFQHRDGCADTPKSGSAGHPGTRGQCLGRNEYDRAEP